MNYLDSDLLHNVEFLQRQGMLWVVDGSDQMYPKLRMILIYSSSVLAGNGRSGLMNVYEALCFRMLHRVV